MHRFPSSALGALAFFPAASIAFGVVAAAIWIWRIGHAPLMEPGPGPDLVIAAMVAVLVATVVGWALSVAFLLDAHRHGGPVVAWGLAFFAVPQVALPAYWCSVVRPRRSTDRRGGTTAVAAPVCP